MTAYIRFRKAVDNKFVSLRSDTVRGVEDVFGKLTENGPEQNLTMLITDGGAFPVDESSNTVLSRLEATGATVIK
ncbi:hypothetical protein EVC27_049 [Rhizobium phage RHph_I1_6]|uniref:Uncharacterized protein n=1 Tax=Rhizobium phage RHph_I1_6 TaxID=2509728 RepID=A0A7S5RNR2_9CAUD|nr:hypothetical protein PP745_gp049 [Rhizobium phage RHph_I1_6]QIG76574.1 hypothetical protein EVC27_049 [Rhizobium phage RHph_I1_6]